MNKKVILILSVVSMVFILSACTSKGEIEAQKQKEIAVIKAQQEKEIAVEKEKEQQAQLKQDKLNACFKVAEEKKLKDNKWTLDYYTGIVCPGIKTEEASPEVVKNCQKRFPAYLLKAVTTSLDEVTATEEKDRAECLKIYPQN